MSRGMPGEGDIHLLAYQMTQNSSCHGLLLEEGYRRHTDAEVEGLAALGLIKNLVILGQPSLVAHAHLVAWLGLLHW
jgi:hypothetical protein